MSEHILTGCLPSHQPWHMGTSVLIHRLSKEICLPPKTHMCVGGGRSPLTVQSRACPTVPSSVLSLRMLLFDGHFQTGGLEWAGQAAEMPGPADSVMEALSCLLSPTRRPAGVKEPVPAAHWRSLTGRGRTEERRSFEFR